MCLAHAAPAVARAQDSLVTPAPLVASPAPRFSAFVDLSGARVNYEGFLPSGVISIAPSMRFDAPNAVVLARASLGRFESGNINTQALAAGGLFTPVWNGVRAEMATQLAIGAHQSLGSSGTVQVSSRLHATSRSSGLWLGAGLGWSSVGGGIGGAARTADLGGWARRGPLRVSAAIQPAAVADLRYVDYEAAARWTLGRVEGGVEGGFRTGDRTVSDPAEGRRAWAALDVVGWIAPTVGLTGGWGSFLPDPGSSTIGGRYLSVGVRIAPLRPPADELPRVLLPRVVGTRTSPDAGSPAGGEELFVTELGNGSVVLQFTLPGVAQAEIMGDFTDWEVEALRRREGDEWELVVRLTPGVHRLNLRTDGGPWRVPPGLTAVSDGYGGFVGLLIVRR